MKPSKNQHELRSWSPVLLYFWLASSDGFDGLAGLVGLAGLAGLPGLAGLTGLTGFTLQ